MKRQRQLKQSQHRKRLKQSPSKSGKCEAKVKTCGDIRVRNHLVDHEAGVSHNTSTDTVVSNDSKYSGSGSRVSSINSTAGYQQILSLVRQVCSEALLDPEFQHKLQAIKKNFFNRRYDAIFSLSSNLWVYAAQYVPARAMCYYNLLRKHSGSFGQVMCPEDIAKWPSKRGNRRKVEVVICGGGPGSEVVGFTQFLANVLQERGVKLSHSISADGGTFYPKKDRRTSSSSASLSVAPRVHFMTYDQSDFSPLFEDLHIGYKVQFRPWFQGLPPNFSSPVCKFQQVDALNLSEEVFLSWQKGKLVTFCFVVGELFACDASKTLAMFVRLKEGLRPGALLLVVPLTYFKVAESLPPLRCYSLSSHMQTHF